MEKFCIGQRWISESEPELGLGTIQRVTDRTVTVAFKASDEQRQYARANAPLKRVQFRVGDRIRSQSNGSQTVKSIIERDGLVSYVCDGIEISETELSDTISFSTPEERLLAGQIDSPDLFDLRVAALEHQHRWRKSGVRGFAGGRIDLIPHQLYIASEVAGRLAPRVLLADEVGLGKTIEACLILHRLILTGRVQRVLILVPESLIHQWFVELLRRFNLWFHIFDEERCTAIEAARPADNPFLDDQLILSSIALFSQNDRRSEQARNAGWDLLVVDEAHHLAWSPDDVSPEYTLVENLSRSIAGLLLLTATPEQLGLAGHFARLRLLDPDRFFDLNTFLSETENYRDIAHSAETSGNNEELEALLDRHGTGRVMFRNTRATIAGFPKRTVHMTPLKRSSTVDRDFDLLSDWLAGLLQDLALQKVLLICRTPAMVAAIDTALKQRIKNVNIAVFHEGLSLIQRDRSAAWFAEHKGAQILLCSEIGSEGRNFQFAHHLVLFDLPFDPELLEQRIGRLDRIGQRSEIHVHVPYVAGTAQEVLARWHHEGLGAFENNLSAGHELFERFGARVYSLAQNYREEELIKLIATTETAKLEVTRQLHEGRDRLLEMNSFRPKTAAQLVEDIRAADKDTSLDAFLLATFDHFALTIEELAPRTYKLGSAGIFAESFPGLPAEGFTVTCDRKRALIREDIQFLSWDHPLIGGAIDLLLDSQKGNCSFAELQDKKNSGLYLEAIFVLECVAPLHLHVDRFLPPTPVQILVDHQNRIAQLPTVRLLPADPHSILERLEFREMLLPGLIQSAKDFADREATRIIDGARTSMRGQLDHEITRLRQLRKINPSVREDEIQLLVGQRDELDHHLAEARPRLDAIRLIQRGLRDDS